MVRPTCTVYTVGIKNALPAGAKCLILAPAPDECNVRAIMLNRYNRYHIRIHSSGEWWTDYYVTLRQTIVGPLMDTRLRPQISNPQSTIHHFPVTLTTGSIKSSLVGISQNQLLISTVFISPCTTVFC